MIHSKSLATGLLAACATLSLSVASAAEPLGTLARIEGSTLINQGEQYVKAREGMAVKEGDRLIATEGSSAVIKFNDGCQFTLTDTQVLTLGPKSTCAGGDTVASYPVNPKPAQAPPGGGTNWAAVGVSAAVLAGVLVAGGAFDDDDDDNPPQQAQRPISP